jgi:hypothetical protein
MLKVDNLCINTVNVLKENLANMKVPAPKGYHWMKSGKTFKLMKDPAGGYKPHKGASKSANFKIQKVHKK